jgi:hypothetical protein
MGINPFVTAQVALIAGHSWVFSYQNTVYLNLMHGTNGTLFSCIDESSFTLADGGHNRCHHRRDPVVADGRAHPLMYGDGWMRLPKTATIASPMYL